MGRNAVALVEIVIKNSFAWHFRDYCEKELNFMDASIVREAFVLRARKRARIQ